MLNGRLEQRAETRREPSWLGGIPPRQGQGERIEEQGEKRGDMRRPREGLGVFPGTAEEAEEEQVPLGAIVEGVPGGEEVGEEDVVG